MKQLSSSCYSGLFNYQHCLILPPELPSYNYAQDAYDYMFSYTSITYLPELKSYSNLYNMAAPIYSSSSTYPSTLHYINVNCTEWGNYVLSLCNDESYGVAFISPLTPAKIYGTGTQSLQCIPNKWIVVTKD